MKLEIYNQRKIGKFANMRIRQHITEQSMSQRRNQKVNDFVSYKFAKFTISANRFFSTEVFWDFLHIRLCHPQTI
jgi:hypothetical protein